MKRVFIIHGWEGYPEEGWFPWLKGELEKQGAVVVVPAMPHADKPQLNEWLPHLQSLVGTPDEQTYFVGHSLGCITILRYLETLEPTQRVGGAVLVAGFPEHLTRYPQIESFFPHPLDNERIKLVCPNLVAIHSDNDKYVALSHAETFRTQFNAEVTILPNMNHFSGNDGVTALPEALDAIKKILLAQLL
jgi:predicted alpha/beta hydrolase family esterase